MTSFINRCRFNPTAGGTSDWTYSSAVTGYNSPSLAGAVNGATYEFVAESSDLSQWEVATGTYNSGTGVFSRTTVLYNSSGTGTASGQSGAGTKINFSSAPQVAVVALAEDIPTVGTWTPALTFSTPGDLSVTYSTQSGQYLVVANYVYAFFQVVTSAFTYTTASGTLRLSGLPFAATANGTGNLQWQGITKANFTDMVCQAVVSSTVLSFTISGSGQVASSVVAADAPSGSSIRLIGLAIYPK